ncbi:MAG: valine--tRNA ligase [Verrucomicrobiota bacterium]|nr:valine--tRNA ligase [Verrucomicrobiota bacterium]
MSEIPKNYDPAEVEQRWYQYWLDNKLFAARVNPDAEPYTIVIPPPNVTGMLTMGHVLNNTLQDVLIRWQRMNGREACWVPGTDHAGIATQNVVERQLHGEGLDRHQLGREAFLERVWAWKEKFGGIIIEQLTRLGASCDWDRERFTMDEGLSAAVREAFVQLYEKDLIYRGKYLVNWCPRCHTALSDDEVEHEEKDSHLWNIRYPGVNGTPDIVVATTRPETMLGDTAVAVHPDDERYRAFHGARVELPLTGRTIAIIADGFVDPAFGTGAVKVTPAHDPNDFEMGMRHELDKIIVIGQNGIMTDACPEAYRGLDRFEARKRVIADLEQGGFMVKIDDHKHSVGTCYRCHAVIEPSLSDQWFVKMKPLAEPALAAVQEGRIRFHPDRWVKTYEHWMTNIRDWCISRQLWWGHRIPAWYCADCRAVTVSRTDPDCCSRCGSTKIEQDPDVLDTWASSWLWPFSTLGWPEKTPELDYFHPTHTLVTGPDIIFFWVARMVMADLEFLGKIPFDDVYFTGIIRDTDGRKMSKSLGNSPDPLDVIRDYGADALRFTIVNITPLGQDAYYSNEKCEQGRNFVTKIWNAARFVRSFERPATLPDLADVELTPDDRFILGRLDETLKAVNGSLQEFRFNHVVHHLYDFFWRTFCDWYLESVKPALYGDDPAVRAGRLVILDEVFSRVLRMMHPVMPFVTEELWHGMGFAESTGEASIVRAPWPQAFTEAEMKQMGITPELLLQMTQRNDLIREGRMLRADYDLPSNRKIEFALRPETAELESFLREQESSILSLLNARKVTIDAGYQPDGPAPSAVSPIGTIFLPLKGQVDLEAEKQRLEQKLAKANGEIAGMEKKLANANFVDRAPAEVVDQVRERLAEAKANVEKLRHLHAAL